MTKITIQLRGRVLWLTDEPDLLSEQLQGIDLEASASDHPTLRYGINTDAMISGAACTKGYTPEILGPHFLEGLDELVPYDGIREGKFQVLVGGQAYGSGSSREVAVVAHQGAGIQLVVAESFQRIFQENLVYAGLHHTADLKIVDQLLAGEHVDTEVLQQSLPPLFRAVSQQGGLLAYAQALLSGEFSPPYRTSREHRAMTVAEHLIARQVFIGSEDGSVGVCSVVPGEQVLCRVGFRGLHEYTAGMVMKLYEESFGDTPIVNPSEVACFADHFVLLGDSQVPEAVRATRLTAAQKLTQEMTDRSREYNIRVHGPGYEGSTGICHRLVVEQYAEPGDIIILTDSHSATSGVLNTFAFGVGSTAMAFALRTGLIPVTVPKTIRVEVFGDAKGYVSPKDLILYIIGSPYMREERWRLLPTDTAVLEFAGPGLNQWNIDELSVLTNMTVEGGMMTGVMVPCEPLREFLKTHRPKQEWNFVEPDPNATYEHRMSIDVDSVPLTIATPGDPRNRASLADHRGTPIHNVVVASCTGGSLADLRVVMNVLRNRSLAGHVRLTVTPASSGTAAKAASEGILDGLREKGATVTEPGCGACIGNGPGIPHAGETTASTTNRNFDRRMGASGPVYLVSPAVAAASAIAGYLEDPRYV
ncbi:MAG: hypothetical protein KTR25_05565 [Myxococcales bacterium]|nr:hypothetical protein [Myxococcales bacterium]